MFEKRRGQLVYFLRERKEEIDLSRQHQIYGAVKEIELFLESIKYFDGLSQKNELDDIVLPKPEKRQSFLKKMRNSVKRNFID